jgi:hypothetical protein
MYLWPKRTAVLSLQRGMSLPVDPAQQQNYFFLLRHLLIDVDNSLILARRAAKHARQLGIYELLNEGIQARLVEIVAGAMVDEELGARRIQRPAWLTRRLLRGLDDAGGERRVVDLGPGLEAGAVVEVVDGGLACPAGDPVVLVRVFDLLAELEGDEAGC